MKRDSLTVAQTRDMLLDVAERMIASEPMLSEADRVIGDGDHGVGMARGFNAVQQKLAGSSFTTLAEVVNAAGMALMMSVGGASGAIFGTFFRGGSKALGSADSLDSAALAQWLGDGLKAVQARGNAQPGDKTMVDVLYPAAQAAAGLTEAALSDSLVQIAAAAEAGMQATKNMVATLGRAKTLGERAIGHPDPGAISMSLILKFMAEFVSREL